MRLANRVNLILFSALVLSAGVHAYSWYRSNTNVEGMLRIRQEYSQLDLKLKDSERQLSESSEQLEKSLATARRTIEREFKEAESILLELARRPTPNVEISRAFARLRYSLKQFISDSANRGSSRRELAVAYWRLGQIYLISGNNSNALVSLQEAVRIADSLNDASLSSYCRNSLGCGLAMTGQPAQREFETALADLLPAGRGSVTHAILLRNLALTQPSRSLHGLRLLVEAVDILEPLSHDIEEAFSLLMDVQMILCEYQWAMGDCDAAAKQCDLVIERLRRVLPDLLASPANTHQFEFRRFNAAVSTAKRNRDLLVDLRSNMMSESTSEEVGETVENFRWKPLFQLSCDLVSPHYENRHVMGAEFDRQTGFLVPWGVGAWSHEIILEILDSVVGQGDVVLAVDDWESYRTAVAKIEQAGLSTDNIRFESCQFEAPWLRDYGPIVATSTNGSAVWLDSRLTRTDMIDRPALDQLPELLGEQYDVKVAPLPIHIEGGMVLSNGRGVVIGSRALVTKNGRYGFDEQWIQSTLRRALGARELVLVDSLIDEPTEHIDLFVSIVSPDTVVVGKIDDPQDPNSRLLDRISDTLSAVEFDGKPLTVARVPMPSTRSGVIYSFTNVVFANGRLLVPTYADLDPEYQRQADAVYRRHLPDWEIRFIECTEAATRGGALHCMISNLGTAQPLDFRDD